MDDGESKRVGREASRLSLGTFVEFAHERSRELMRVEIFQVVEAVRRHRS